MRQLGPGRRPLAQARRVADAWPSLLRSHSIAAAESPQRRRHPPPTADGFPRVQSAAGGRCRRLRRARVAQAGDRRGTRRRSAHRRAARPPRHRRAQRLPAAADDPRRPGAGTDAHGDLRRLPGAAGPQDPAGRDGLARAVRLPRCRRRRVRGAEGRRRDPAAVRAGLRVLAAVRPASGAPRAEPRGGAGADADPADRRHRPAVRRLPFRPLRRDRRRHRARARVGVRRRRARQRLFRAVAGRAGRRLPCLVLDPDRRRPGLPGAAAVRRAFPHRDGAAGAVLPARPPGQPRALGRPREADERRRRCRERHRRRAHRARSHLEGGARRLHLHRVRPLQGRLPDFSHRQAAVAEVGARQPEAPPAGAARGRSSTRPRGKRCCRRWSAT